MDRYMDRELGRDVDEGTTRSTRGDAASAEEVAAVLLARLGASGQSLAVAESLTGGRLAAAVTSVPGASAVFLGGVVSYATAVKTDLLGVPEEVVVEYGVVSAECAEVMAAGVQRLLGSTWALSTTGVAGPDRQEGHAVGTVFVGLAGPDGTASRRLALAGDRAGIQRDTCREALRLLAETVA